MKESFFAPIGRSIIPKRVRPDLRLFLMKTGHEEVPYSLFGMIFLFVSIVSLMIFMGFFYLELAQYSMLQFGFLSFITFSVTTFLLIFTSFVVLYFYWNIIIFKRTKELELLLPDYLTLVSTNLKGGMSFENSLWSSIKPEFGILANEVGLASKRVMTGNEVTEALMEFSMKYDSPVLRRTMQLLIGEVESGGKVVDTIDKIIIDMKKTEALKKEMAASTVTYMIFIGMLVAVISPVLFALAIQLFNLTGMFVSSIAGSTTGPGGLSVSASSIDKGDFRLFSILAIAIISIFSSMILAIIEKGDIKSGIRYIPMFLVASETVYFIASGIFGMIFGGFVIV